MELLSLTPTIDVEGLAALLCCSAQTVKSNASRSPEKLPLPVRTGGRRLIWITRDVLTWLEARRACARCTRGSPGSAPRTPVPSGACSARWRRSAPEAGAADEGGAARSPRGRRWTMMSTGERHTIEIRASELAEAVDLAEAALLAADAGIYQRGGQLVRVVPSDPPPRREKNTITRAVGTPIIMPVTREFLLLALSRYVTFRKYDARMEEWRQVDPPSTLAALLLAAGEWQFPRLRGAVCPPTLRTDGSLLAAPGYDLESGLLAWNDGTIWPTINPQPSAAEAAEALAVLRDLLREFDFSGGQGGPHESAAFAAIPTAAVRHALPIAPGFGIDAHKMGSGKTELVHTVSRIVTGCQCDAARG